MAPKSKETSKQMQMETWQCGYANASQQKGCPILVKERHNHQKHAQAASFYGSMASEGLLCHLNAGDTMLIPSGWPHAVVTQEDSIVVGGNFLHGFHFE